MVTRTEWYARVNAAWPAEVPALIADEAIRAARKLYRFCMGRTLTLPIKVTSGNRYTWARGGVLSVNPTSTHHGGGWMALIHDLSHWLHRKVSDAGPHDKSHARLELRLINEVVKRGWLSGSLKTKPKAVKSAPDARVVKYQRIQGRMKRWEAKQKRAAKALSKLRRQAAYYERVGLTLH